MLSLTILISTVLNAQNVRMVETNIVDSIGIKDSPFDAHASNKMHKLVKPDIRSEFPGGQDSLYYLLEHSFNYFKMNYGGKRGEIDLALHLDRQGAVSYIEWFEQRDSLTKKPNILSDKQFVSDLRKIVRQLPKWSPAKLAGRGVPTIYVLKLSLPYMNFKSMDLRGDSTICKDVDSFPDFRFGEHSMLIDRIGDFTRNTIRWPSEIDCEGVVFYQCVVEVDGTLSTFKLIRGINTYCNEEALRVLKCMPEWKPAEQKGRRVRTTVVIPVSFVLSN
jgi:hypothetical protein